MNDINWMNMKGEAEPCRRTSHGRTQSSLDTSNGRSQHLLARLQDHHPHLQRKVPQHSVIRIYQARDSRKGNEGRRKRRGRRLAKDPAEITSTKGRGAGVCGRDWAVQARMELGPLRQEVGRSSAGGRGGSPGSWGAEIDEAAKDRSGYGWGYYGCHLLWFRELVLEIERAIWLINLPLANSSSFKIDPPAASSASTYPRTHRPLACPRPQRKSTRRREIQSRGSRRAWVGAQPATAKR